MENVVDFVNKFVIKISPRDDISGRLKVFHNIKEKSIKSFKDYFFVTELCTPTDTFIGRTIGKEKSQKLKEILAQGNKLHAIVQNWLKKHKDYCGSEAILDGRLIGIPARGLVDGRIDEAIIEIKSIEKLPKTSKEIIEKYPQYIEQVAFYSILDPLNPKENYLVFITKDYPYKIKSFKLSITNSEAIKNILKKRVYFLNEILEGKKNPEILGKCRYCYEKDCSVKGEGKCSLFNLEALKCEVKDHIKLEEDEGFNSEIENLRKKFGENYKFYSAYNLLCPRKYCLKELYGLKETFEDENSATKIYFGNLIYKFRKKEGSFEEKENGKFSEFALNKYNWFKDITSLYPEGKKTPFITYVTNYPNFDRPHDYKIAELGVYLIAHGLSKGLIFSYYPKKNKIKVFEITFDFKGDYFSEIKNIIKGLENPENFSSLPKCSDWMCGKCVYFGKCNV